MGENTLSTVTPLSSPSKVPVNILDKRHRKNDGRLVMI